jgi:hypothetical protein
MLREICNCVGLPVSIKSSPDKNSTSFSVNGNSVEIITADGSMTILWKIITINRRNTGSIVKQVPDSISMPAKMTGKIHMCPCMCRKRNETVIGVVTPVNRFNGIN